MGKLDAGHWTAGLKFTADWFCRRSKPLWEQHLASRAPFKSYLEIGVYEGMSLAYVCRNFLDPNGTAAGVDSWRPVRDTPKWIADAARIRGNAFANLMVLKANTQQFVTIYQNDSRIVLSKLYVERHKFDLIYVDGGHRADCALLDLCLSWEMLDCGGVMVVDDLHLDAVRRRRHDPKVREAWNAFTATRLGIKTIYDTGDQVAVEKYRARLPKHPGAQ